MKKWLILLSVLLLCACLLACAPAQPAPEAETPEPTQAPTPTPTPTATPEPTATPTPAPVTESTVIRDANAIAFIRPDGIMASISWEDSDVTVSLIDPELTETYEVNKPETKDNYGEYGWQVGFTDGSTEFEVSTNHFKFPGSNPETLSPKEMQNTLGVIENGSTSIIGNAALEMTGKQMLWKTGLPEKYQFDFKKIEFTSISIMREFNFFGFPSFVGMEQFYNIEAE